jgi:hypothetical protein
MQRRGGTPRPPPRCRCVIESNSRNGCGFPSASRWVPFVGIFIPGDDKYGIKSVPAARNNNKNKHTIFVLQFVVIALTSSCAHRVRSVFTVNWRAKSP